RDAEGLLDVRQAPVQHDVELELRLAADHRPHRPGEEEAGEEEAPRGDDDHYDDDAVDDDADAGGTADSNDALSHSGVRVGRRVFASTVPCSVQPSASSEPSRSTTKQKRNRAPRRAWRRAWTSSRSSKNAGDLKCACDSSTSDSIPWSRSRW